MIRASQRRRAAGLLVAALAGVVALALWAPPTPGQGVPPAGPALADWVASGKGGKYVGSAACVPCHEAQSRQRDTPMAHALEEVAASDVLARNPRLSFRDDKYTYRIATSRGRAVFTVTGGGRSISEPVLHVFGHGVLGQTYLVKHAGAYVEARASYFRGLGGLGVTIGQRPETPASLDEALGRRLVDEEVRSCFGCHAPLAFAGTPVAGTPFAGTPVAGTPVPNDTTGVGCESCHGPGEAHVAAARVPGATDLKIFDPTALAGDELTQHFCGSCHLGFDQAILLPGQGGPTSVRFQASRLFSSKGHRGPDARISCVACHDPHGPLAHDPESYDSACTSCHRASGTPAGAAEGAAGAKACPVSAKTCVTCHMPKVELAGMHGEFTDHLIRVVKPEK